MLIRFTSATDERKHGAAYKEGDTADLPYPSAHRWLRRGLAVEVTKPPEGLRMRSRPMMGSRPEPSTEPAPPAPESVEASKELVEQEAKPKPRGRPKKRA